MKIAIDFNPDVFLFSIHIFLLFQFYNTDSTPLGFLIYAKTEIVVKIINKVKVKAFVLFYVTTLTFCFSIFVLIYGI